MTPSIAGSARGWFRLPNPISKVPLRIQMTPTVRARFREAPPEGVVPLAVAMGRLGVTRQTVWERIKAAGWTAAM